MTHNHLDITNEELLLLKKDYPLEIGVIMEMLAEVNEEETEFVEDVREAA